VPGEARPADRDAIRAHIEAIFRAYMRRDRAALRATHAAHWRGFIRPSRGIVRGLDDAREGGHWNQAASQVATHPDTLAASRQEPRTLTPSDREGLLAAREAVWRAYFAGDAAHLAAVLPDETIAINAGEEDWAGRDALLAASRAFAANGRLLRLEFPKTEIRVYGDVAVLYTTYAFEVEAAGERSSHAGRGTEVFVHRGGRWVNPGWHLDSGQ
jgi:ketosteroid isomerase-like protein